MIAELREQAWGAHFARERRLASAIPALIVNLSAAQHRIETGAASKSDDNQVIDHTLDALISLGAAVPADLLSRVDREIPTVILQLRDPAANAHALLGVFLGARPNSVLWLATANSLARLHLPTFVAALVKTVRVRVHLRVGDSTHCSGIEGHQRGGIVAAPLGLAGDTFPRLGTYGLGVCEASAALMVSRGPHSVCATRYENGCTHSETIDADDYRLELVAEALGVDSRSLPITHEESRNVSWSGAAGLRANAEKIREDIEKNYAALVLRLREAKLLDDAAPSRVEFDFSPIDCRANKSEPLEPIFQP